MLNSIRVDGRFPIHLAAATGNATHMQSLLASPGTNPDSLDQADRTPLTYAILASAKPIVEMLLQAGANPNTPDNDGRTGTPYPTAS